MAQSGVVLNKDQFTCPICLDVLKDPVTIPCGHSYCSACIQHYWDQHLWEWDCPQCRQTFNHRPQPGRNIMLAEVMEKLKNMGLQATSVPEILSLAGPEDVACDVCTGRKSKAFRSCLVCLVSYCEAHLQPHCTSPAFKNHKLVPALTNLQEMTCRHHNKLLEVYCRTDKQFICYLCLTGEHKGHNTVLAETEVQDKQTELEEIKKSSRQRIQNMENEVLKLQQASLSFSCSTRLAIEECDKMFTGLIHSIELNREGLRKLFKEQEKTAGGQVEEVLKKLQKEITELKNRDAELEKLSQTEDHIHFLRGCQSLKALPVLEALPSVKTDSGVIFGPLMAAVSTFKDTLQDACWGGLSHIYDKVREVTIIECLTPSTEPNEQTNVQMHSTLGSTFPGPTLSTSISNPQSNIYDKVREVTIIECPTPSTEPNEQTNVQMHSSLGSTFTFVFTSEPTLSTSISNSKRGSRKKGYNSKKK